MQETKPDISETRETLRQPHLLDYWHIITKRRWVVFACLFICMTTAFVADQFRPPSYRTTATLMIDEGARQVPLPNQPYVYEDYYQKQRAFETHFKVMKSYPLVEKVVARVGLEEYLWRKPLPPLSPLQLFWKRVREKTDSVLARLKKAFFEKPRGETGEKALPPSSANESENLLTPAPLVTNLMGAIEIAPVQETNLVRIQVTHRDPWIATTTANTLAEVYREYISERQKENLQHNLQWMSQEAYRLKERIKNSQQELHRYREKTRLLKTAQENSMQEGELGQLRKAHHQTRSRRLELEAQVAELSKIVSNKANYIPSFINNEALEHLVSQRIAANLEKEKLSNRYKKMHPRILAVQAKTESLREQFIDEIEKALGSVKSEYLVLASKEKEQERAIKDYTEQIIKSDRLKIQHAMLEREVEANQDLYNLLMRQLKSLNLAESVQGRTIRIIEKAKFPAGAVRPNKTLNLLVSVLLGLTIGTAAAFFFDYLDCTIKDSDDVKEYLKAPVLGVIPAFDRTTHYE